ncbi:hypothetical protein RHMOL_Rhmol03G0158400 [Rhododendron molle]|uniref:Uncharacterized protein n=1 Tax=Rhododendron molle TaxID=49168 RepID=A0ACC0PFC5_RHOML|nr:hypothetical protein RHMOL_Rhmol03G0158400 [Rhododendron molle]
MISMTLRYTTSAINLIIGRLMFILSIIRSNGNELPICPTMLVIFLHAEEAKGLSNHYATETNIHVLISIDT